jgi:hypothetical protein
MHAGGGDQKDKEFCRGRSKTGQRRFKTGQGDGAKPDFFVMGAQVIGSE